MEPYVEPYILDLMFTVFSTNVTGIVESTSQVAWHVSVLVFVVSKARELS